MIRHGMVTIGVAVQAETFTNTPVSQSNLASTSTTSPTFPSTTARSAIFLAPSKNGSPQSLRITFAYNKDTNLPEVLINLDEGGEGQYLKVKGDDSILPDKSLSSNNSLDISKALQVYAFEKMDSPSTTQVYEVPENNSPKPQKDYSPPDTKNKGVKKAGSNSSKSSDSKVVQVTRNEIEAGESPDSENINPSNTSTNVPKASSNGQKENDPSKGRSDQRKEGEHNHPNEKATVETKKVPSPRNNKSRGPSKSSSKSNGRATRKKSKSRVVILENGESLVPGSPGKGISEKSKIPFINSAATGFLPCEYYRQKWLQENGCTDPASWNDYTCIQKTAGQKVINKMTAQQKKLEEDAVAQRKRTEFSFHEDLGGLDVSQNIIPIRKKQTRLEPLRTIPKCH